MEATIRRLKLSSNPNLLRTRKKWFQYFRGGKVTLEVLEAEFPFLAAEIKLGGPTA